MAHVILTGFLLLAILLHDEGPTFTSEPQSTGVAKSSQGAANASIKQLRRGDRRPNILIIISDDQRFGTLDVMPQTRRWFQHRGVTYSRSFTTTPLCCPARASMMTGLYAHNHRVRNNPTPPGPRASWTLQKYLHRGGYKTAIAGKYLNSVSVRRDPRWFDKWATFSSGYYNARFNINGRLRTVNRYSTRFVGAKSRDFLRGFERRDKAPWFLIVSPYAPHHPATPESRHARAPVPAWNPSPAMAESNRSDKPPHIRRRSVDLAWVRDHRRNQFRSLRSVDDIVGSVAAQLNRLNEARRTLAFYLSDNGYLWGEHGVASKRYPYTYSVKIPFLARWPGHLPRGATSARFTLIVDIAPTVLHAARLRPRVPMDGRSLLRRWWRKRVLLEFYRDANPEIDDISPWASIRTKHHQYVEYYRRERIVFREFYRLGRDPWQLTNVLHDGRTGNEPPRRRLRALHSQLRRLRRCSGRECR